MFLRNFNYGIPRFSERAFRHLLDENGKIESRTQAIGFVKYIFDRTDPGANKLDTLARLTSSQYGLPALEAAISFEMSLDFIREAVISLIRSLGNDGRMTSGTARGTTVLKLLRTVYKSPNLFEKMIQFVVETCQFGGEEAFELGWMVLQLVKAGDETSAEVRKNEHVARLVRYLASCNYPGSNGVSEEISNFLTEIHCETGAKFEVEGVDSLRSKQPGGRHDNDKADFRSIATYPTTDELKCLKPAFLPQTKEIFESGKKGIPHYLDWAFRLLRDDVVESIREEIDLLLRKGPFDKSDKTSHKLLERLKNRTVNVLTFPAISFDHRFGIALKMEFEEPPQIRREKRSSASAKQEYWERRRNFLKENSLIVFIRNESELAFLGYVNVRDVKKLTTQRSPSIDVVLIGKEANREFFLELGTEQTNLKAVQLSASFFAYEPILERLKLLSNVPFKEEILSMSKLAEKPSYYSGRVRETVETLEIYSSGTNVAPVLCLPKELILDQSQKEAVVNSLKNRVALIQGPPGTGKSFCGAIISKIIHDFSRETILCVCYTNHALDQFLEELIRFGLPDSEMVRLGGAEKMSERISKLAIGNLLKDEKCARWIVGALHSRMEAVEVTINVRLSRIQRLAKTKKMTDFSLVIPPSFANAVRMPSQSDGFQIVGEKGTTLGPDYLWEQWIDGKDRGVIGKFFSESNSALTVDNSYWSLDAKEREKLVKDWRDQLVLDDIEAVERLMAQFNELKTELMETYNKSKCSFLQSKRIIGCTTTGAAKYAKELDSVNAGVLIIEEAGELLEPHVITSMASNCKHLIMIGDHKQLRPKLNVYQLTVESGSPYEFNRSLFERLVLNGFPHVTLELQHRMRPEFSHLIRELTYPNLKDAEKVKGHPNLLGTRSNLIFIQHEHEEGASSGGNNPHNLAVSVDDCMSKVNFHEVVMVTKIAEYLIGQGYRGEQIVILTPYLGQLQALREALSKSKMEADLSERDVADLNQFGLIDSPSASPTFGKSLKTQDSIRVATVDNYQGEESDIIIASLVRSNKDGIIGFVGEPERVNVLLSRARLGMILIGNMRTFENAKSAKARQLWAKLLEMLKEKGAIFPGFPAFCSVHEKNFILEKPEDFAKFTPDGGCDLECEKMLSCGRHKCTKKCHRVPADHSRVECESLVQVSCPKFPSHEVEISCKLSKDPENVAKICAKMVSVKCPSKDHSLTIECKLSSNSTVIGNRCRADVEVLCPKGHPVTVPCRSASDSSLVSSRCKALIEVTCSENGHVLTAPCNMSDKRDFIASQCQTQVEVKCPVSPQGHLVSVPCCKSKLQSYIAGMCKSMVEIACPAGKHAGIPVRCCDSAFSLCPDCFAASDNPETKASKKKGNPLKNGPKNSVGQL